MKKNISSHEKKLREPMLKV